MKRQTIKTAIRIIKAVAIIVSYLNFNGYSISLRIRHLRIPSGKAELHCGANNVNEGESNKLQLA